MSSTGTPVSRNELPVLASTSARDTGIDHELLLDCVHCGLCTSACPTYVELGTEMDSPRGRIYLMRAVTEGRLDLDAAVRHHLDLCLDCRACESACPSGVQYGRLIEPFRMKMAETVSATANLGWFKRCMLFKITPYARRMRWMLKPAKLMQWTGLDWLLRKIGFFKILPRSLRQFHDMLPPLGSSRAVQGRLRPELAAHWGLGDDVIISAGGGDNMMGAIGTGNIKPGVITASFGTSGTLYGVAAEPVVARDGVGAERGVHVPQVRLGVGVVDRRRDVKRAVAHGEGGFYRRGGNCHADGRQRHLCHPNCRGDACVALHAPSERAARATQASPLRETHVRQRELRAL